MERRDLFRGALAAGLLGAPQLPSHTNPPADIVIERAVSGTPHQGKTLAVITPHLDDGPFFACGTVAKLLREGYTGYFIRTSNDEKDSYDLTLGETVLGNELAQPDLVAELIAMGRIDKTPITVNGKTLAEAKGEILHSADTFEWFAEEIVNAGIHRVQIVGFSRAHGNQDDVSETLSFLGANSSAELQPVDTRHHPIGDDELVVLAFPCFPRFTPICDFGDAVSQLDQGRANQKSASTVVIGDEDIHFGPLEADSRCTKCTVLVNFLLSTIDGEPR